VKKLKYKILTILRENAPEFISGEDVSKLLGVSRTAIWKNIKQLTAEGYDIAASSRNGYQYLAAPDELNAFEISYELGTRSIGKKIIFFEEIDSTNNRARLLAEEGAEDGTVVVALHQTAGKGRMGRTWDSATGKGIYLSVILKPDSSPAEMQKITIATATAVVSAIKKLTGMPALIKWPNDIILQGKKVCGILTEMNTELVRINYIIPGIGINYSQKRGDFPEELQDKAISLTEYAGQNNMEFNCSKLDIVRSFLKELDNLYFALLSGDSSEIVAMWKKNSATLGKEVKIIHKDKELEGTAIDITDEGLLVVRFKDGRVEEISSGEVSVRGLLGYS
jgi:BirA family biotin operon repressor/biotin-[acetyl-CoA-carboxylase] ligase